MMIFALDIATTTGFAIGEAGADRPEHHGSLRFGSPGSSREATFAKAYSWAAIQFEAHRPNVIVWEAPIPTSFSFKGKDGQRGGTNIETTTMLFGLPAVIGAAAYAGGFYEMHTVRTVDVRNFFLHANPPRAEAKRRTKLICRKLGCDVVDDNAADAVAIWFYQSALINPLALKRVAAR